MTDQQRARALSGATRECPEYCKHGERCGNFHSALNACLSCSPTCKCCKGTGRVPILNPERARKRCLGYHEYVKDGKPQWSTSEHGDWCCHGDGWLSTLLEEPEKCSAPHRITVSSSRCHRCGLWQTDEPGLVQAWRLQLLIELLEEAGWKVEYRMGVWYVIKDFDNHGSGDTLAIAACEALKAEGSPSGRGEEVPHANP